MRYIALISDFQGSKASSNSLEAHRPELQSNLEVACGQLNRRRVALRLLSPFAINQAGAAQALFSSADALWISIFELAFAMHPNRLCYGIGVGEVDKGFSRLRPDQIDGEALDLARGAIHSLKADAKSFRLAGVEEHDQLIKHSLDLASYLTKSWRKNRIGTFVGLLKQQPAADIAQQLQITEQAVYRNIRDGELVTLLALFKEISARIDTSLRN